VEANENPQQWKGRRRHDRGQRPRSHLFMSATRKVAGDFQNFHFKADVQTTPGSNSGIFFHTRYQNDGGPRLL